MDIIFDKLGLVSTGFAISSLVRLLLAVICGGIVGYERENNKHPAGLRTHVLVCLGSALVMIISEYLFLKYGSTDPARMGAQVISGIGFLGAGTIIKEGISIKGLTTAATLWAVSCVGLAVGVGFYSGAIISTVFIYFTLKVVKKIVAEHYRKVMVIISFQGDIDISESTVQILENHGFDIQSTAIYKKRGSESCELRLYAESKKNHDDISVPLSKIQLLDGVLSISLGHSSER